MDLSKRAILDIRALPCQALSDEEIVGDTEHSEVACNEDQKAAIDYLDQAQIVMYFNRGSFLPEVFESQPVMKQSVLKKVKFNNKEPNQFLSFI